MAYSVPGLGEVDTQTFIYEFIGLGVGVFAGALAVAYAGTRIKHIIGGYRETKLRHAYENQAVLERNTIRRDTPSFAGARDISIVNGIWEATRVAEANGYEGIPLPDNSAALLQDPGDTQEQ